MVAWQHRPNRSESLVSRAASTEPFRVAAGEGLADVWWKTGRLTVKIGAAETGDSFSQLETIDPRGTATPTHIHHNEDESFYVLEGDVSLFVGGERIELSTGDFAFAPRGIPHAYIVTSERARILTTLCPGGLEEVFVASGLPVVGNARPDREVMPSIDEMARRMSGYGCEVVGPPPTLADEDGNRPINKRR